MVASLFVNPAQFGPGEDLDRYPRTFEEDRALCDREGVDILFAPSVDEVYPGGDPSKAFTISGSASSGVSRGRRTRAFLPTRPAPPPRPR